MIRGGQFQTKLIAPMVESQASDQGMLFIDPVETYSIEEQAVLVRRLRAKHQNEMQHPDDARAEELLLLSSDFHLPLERPDFNSGKKGGAVGGAVKRRCIQSSSEAVRHITTADDISLWTPAFVNTEIFPESKEEGELVHNGILWTAAEYGELTISPNRLAKRIKSAADKGTVGRHQDSIRQRVPEVVYDGMLRRKVILDARIGMLALQGGDLIRFNNEAKAPGRSHMSRIAMDYLMLNAEITFATMQEAIMTRHEAQPDRVASHKAALTFLLTNDSGKGAYNQTVGYWQGMAQVATNWTKAKTLSLNRMSERLDTEVAIWRQKTLENKTF
jgi:hypothetical protein